MSDQPLAEQLLERMVKNYNSAAYSTDTEVTFQFTGEGAGRSPYYLKLQNGRISWQQGELSYCKLTLEVDTTVWQDIMDKKRPFNLMDRSFIIKGNNFAMLAKFPQIFGFA